MPLHLACADAIPKITWKSIEVETPEFRPSEDHVYESFKSEEGAVAGDGRIAFGTPASGPDQFPFMARLAKETSPNSYTTNCGGSVIAPTFILSAG